MNGKDIFKQIMVKTISLIVIMSTNKIAIATDTSLTSGTCGTNLTWFLDTSKETLTISGTGNMTDFTDESNYAPWYSYHNSIKKITISNGVTSIGHRAFIDCTNLTSINLPDSIIKLGTGAFCNCTSLTSVKLPNNLTSFSILTFSDCIGLTSIDIPPSVIDMGTFTFNNCTGLTSVNILSTRIISFRAGTFRDCIGVTSIKLKGAIPFTNLAFAPCKALKHFTYGGISEPQGVGTLVLSSDCPLKVVDVPRNYKNSTFCGMPIRRIPATVNCKPKVFNNLNRIFL